MVPAETPVGKIPNPSLTLSPSSLLESSVAVNVKVFSVSVAPKMRLAGTPL